MRELVSKKDLMKATGLNDFWASPLMHVLRFSKINRIYDRIFDDKGVDFIKSLLRELGVSIEVHPEELKRIPKSGPFITVSNHPYGSIDGVILILLLHQVRPDAKVMANFLLKQVDPIKEYFIAVNPFEQMGHLMSNTNGLKEAIAHLQEGMPLGIFPAGEVSTYVKKEKKIVDKPWTRSTLRFIKKAKVPVVPIYFDGGNSKLFHLLGMLHPMLRTAALPREMVNKNGETVRMRIGTPISAEEQNSYADPESFEQFLRMKTYTLGSGLKEKNPLIPLPQLFVPKKQKIVPPLDRSLIKNELAQLKDHLLLEKDRFQGYVANAEKIPAILTEIGRLREVTFREAGEGTNKSMDIDQYDYYFKHLFIWDTEKEEVVGSYRIGRGKDIMEAYGTQGFYISSLFKLKEEFESILSKSFELGRSFIQRPYQKERLPLFLLWRGLFLYFKINRTQHDYQYMLGPVSISNQYASYSKSLIAAFIKKYHFNEELAQLVRPKKAYKFKEEDDSLQQILECTKDDLKKIDSYIRDIDPSHFAMPILLKKYLYQNGKIIGFNIDPKFNNCLDGLIIVDFNNLPKRTVQNLEDELAAFEQKEELATL
ncbi:MAG: lysophospholipid acyltransferase family protein [Cytophagales bacterium]|nr:lysophospholipid acyltransferase family protein [Cytophagales bacterium]